MESIREIYKIGIGPSSSHTMGPQNAAKTYLEKFPNHKNYQVTLFGSLAATGKGHLTDKALYKVFSQKNLSIVWKANQTLAHHPNGMIFHTMENDNSLTNEWEVYSVGGGSLEEKEYHRFISDIYEDEKMETILKICTIRGITFWEYVQENEGDEIWDFLQSVWIAMQKSIDRGIENEGVLPGNLGVSRKGSIFYRKAKMTGKHFYRSGILSAYALAVAEENASGNGIIVTAPTCGSCGVLPAVLRYLQETIKCSNNTILRALATAGLIGNLVKKNASISGAEVGCQGEIGTACAMASAAAVQILGGTIRQIEYAAEMGLEHHLGLTCDPVNGMVQIPCIERNAFAAKRAVSCADYALFSDGYHRISFDEVVKVMKRTGNDLPSLYRETSEGGLAKSRLS